MSRLEELESKAFYRLEYYEPIDEFDDTKKILKIFLDRLPIPGSKNLMIDVIELEEDAKIRQLKDHLVTAILVACKSLLFLWYLLVPVVALAACDWPIPHRVGNFIPPRDLDLPAHSRPGHFAHSCIILF